MNQLKKYSSFLFLFTAVVTILFINLSCEDNPVTPEDPPPGSRDYTWEIDTIKFSPFNSLDRIWGSSPDDIWAVQPGGDLDKTIWHFNGIEWENDGVSRAISPQSVWGFSENNVWLGGGDGRIWHYDGTSWSENVRFEKSVEMRIGFSDMWGDSPNNLFAVGYSGYEENRIAVIAHYDGTEWKLIEFPDLNYSFIRIKGEINSKKYFVLGYSEVKEASNFVALYELILPNSIKRIYEEIYSKNTRAFPQSIDGEIYFVIGNKIYNYVNNQFNLITNINNSNFGLQIFGRSFKDIFLRMENGIAHYNGNDVNYLYKFNKPISIADAVILENEVFFLANDFNNNLNLVFRGKLK